MQPFERTEFGEYILHDRIGAGGMAEIFLATAEGIAGFERRLVIKRILPTFSGDDQFVRMFIEEAKLCEDLKHPNIVEVYDLGEIDSQYFIAMEYVDGRDLLKTLAMCGKKRIGFPTDIALYIVMEVLNGLSYAHSLTRADGRPLGIIHRDVSPSNVLLSFSGEVKIADFGIAKASTREKTETGILKGKFGYMAPEQVTGAPIDHRADVFAIGIVLYELLTGHRLFAGKNDLAVLERVRDALIEPPPRYYRPDLSGELEGIVLRALSRDPRARFQHANELRDALHDYTYRSRAVVGPTQLSRFMQELFLADAEELERRRKMSLPAVPPAAVRRTSFVRSVPPIAPVRPMIAPSLRVDDDRSASTGGFDDRTPLLEQVGGDEEVSLSGLAEEPVLPAPEASRVVYIAPDEQWERDFDSAASEEETNDERPKLKLGGLDDDDAYTPLVAVTDVHLVPVAQGAVGRSARALPPVPLSPLEHSEAELTARTEVASIQKKVITAQAIEVHTGLVLTSADEVRAMRRAREENQETELDLDEQASDAHDPSFPEADEEPTAGGTSPLPNPEEPTRSGRPKTPTREGPSVGGSAKRVSISRQVSGVDTLVGPEAEDEDDDAARTFSPAEIVERTYSSVSELEDGTEEARSGLHAEVEPTVKFTSGTHRRLVLEVEEDDFEELREISAREVISLRPESETTGRGEGGSSPHLTTRTASSPAPAAHEPVHGRRADDVDEAADESVEEDATQAGLDDAPSLLDPEDDETSAGLDEAGDIETSGRFELRAALSELGDLDEPEAPAEDLAGRTSRDAARMASELGTMQLQESDLPTSEVSSISRVQVESIPRAEVTNIESIDTMEGLEDATDDHRALVPLGAAGSGLSEATESDAGPIIVPADRTESSPPPLVLARVPEALALESLEAEEPTAGGAGSFDDGGDTDRAQPGLVARPTSRRRSLSLPGKRPRPVLLPAGEEEVEPPPELPARAESLARRAPLRAASLRAKSLAPTPRRRVTTRASLSVLNPQPFTPPVEPVRPVAIEARHDLAIEPDDSEVSMELTGAGFLVPEADREPIYAGLIDSDPNAELLDAMPARRASSGVTAALDEAAFADQEIELIRSQSMQIPVRGPTTLGSLADPDGPIEELEDEGKTDLHDGVVKRPKAKPVATNGVVLFGEGDRSTTDDSAGFDEESQSIPIITSGGRLDDDGASDLFGALSAIDGVPLELQASFAHDEEVSMDTEAAAHDELDALRDSLAPVKSRARSITWEPPPSDDDYPNERESSLTGLGSLAPDEVDHARAWAQLKSGPNAAQSKPPVSNDTADEYDFDEGPDERTASVTDGQVMDSQILKPKSPLDGDSGPWSDAPKPGFAKGGKLAPKPRDASGIELDFAVLSGQSEDDAIEELEPSQSTSVGEDMLGGELGFERESSELHDPSEQRAIAREELTPAELTPAGGLDGSGELDLGLDGDGVSRRAPLRLVSNSFDLNVPLSEVKPERPEPETRAKPPKSASQRDQARASTAAFGGSKGDSPAPQGLVIEKASSRKKNGVDAKKDELPAPVRPAAPEARRAIREVKRPNARAPGAQQPKTATGGMPPAAALVATAGPRMAPTPVMLVPSASQAYPPLAQAERSGTTNKLLTAVVLLATVLAVAAAVTLLLERGKPINAIAIKPEKAPSQKTFVPEPARDPAPAKTPDDAPVKAPDAAVKDEPPGGSALAKSEPPKDEGRARDDAAPRSDDARAPDRAPTTDVKRATRDPSVGIERVAPEEARAETAVKKIEPAKRPAPKKTPVREPRPKPIAVDPTMGLISIECAEPATVTVLGKGKFPNVTRQAIKVEPGPYLLVITRNGTKLKSVTVNAIAGQAARISCDD
jgi:serine/threonine protein kinase